MRNIILVALLVMLATVVGCKTKESQPTENTMGSTEQSQQKMQASPEAMEEPAAAAQAPADGDGAGSAQ